MLNSKSVLGLNLLRIADQHPDVLERAARAIVDLAARGTVVPVVDRAFPAAEVAAAHEYVESRKSMGKVILRW
jgi:NADPH:quinone reductase-like Zn-dependent oxidoreductase